MPETPHYPNLGDSTGVSSGSESPPGIPRWVKLSAMIVVVVALVVVAILLTGIAGEHGPGRHG